MFTQAVADFGWRLSAHEQRLSELGAAFFVVDASAVDLDRLLNCKPGSIVGVKARDGAPVWSVRDEAPLGVVAGWISEDE